MAELVIRQAEERDIAAIETLEQQCFAVPWTYESLYHDVMHNKLAFYIVAEADGVLCGWVGIWTVGDEGHISTVAVAPDYRRRHIARAMLEVLIETCGQSGITSYTLEVRVGNAAARKLYEGLGFADAGVRKGYYEDNGEDALIMWKGKLWNHERRKIPDNGNRKQL